MALSVVQQYRQLVQHIPQLIEVSGYRNDYVAKKMGLQPASFSAKTERGNWTPDEVLKLISIIDNEDVDDYLMLQMMRRLKAEEAVSYKDLKQEMGWS